MKKSFLSKKGVLVQLFTLIQLFTNLLNRKFEQIVIYESERTRGIIHNIGFFC